MSTSNFLGTGWSFPVQFDKTKQQVVMLSNEADIKNSLQVLLATGVGERIMQPNFGCNLNVLLFESINTSLTTYLRDLVFTAIYYFEPRIQPDKVVIQTTDTEGLVEVLIEYTIRATNSRHNIVYPFYLDEGNLTPSQPV